MYRKAFFLVVVICLFIFLGCSANEPEKKPLPEKNTVTYDNLFEEAQDNPHTNGCVSCHKKTEEIDRSISAYVKRIEGHPKVEENRVSDCYECHEAQKDYELYQKFYQGMHSSHWLSETFYKELKGRCYSCHTVEKNGISGIKDYPLAGYRTNISKQREEKVKPEVKKGKEDKEGDKEKAGETEENKTTENIEENKEDSQSTEQKPSGNGDSKIFIPDEQPNLFQPEETMEEQPVPGP